jgi:hypothetical protein
MTFIWSNGEQVCGRLHPMSNALKVLGIVAWLLAARLPAAEPAVEVTPLGDHGITCDQADAVLVSGVRPQEPPGPTRFTVATPSVTVRLSNEGQIVGLTAGRFEQAIR